MIKITKFVICAIIIFFTTRGVRAEGNGSSVYKGYKGASGVVELLYTKRHLDLGVNGRDFIRDACLNLGVKEQDVIQQLADRIVISGSGGSELDDSRLNDDRARSSKAAFYAMCIYPGNEQIEKAVFDASRWELYNYPSNFSDHLSTIRTYGSLELLEEMNALISNHPSLSAQDSNKFVSYLHESNEKIRRIKYTNANGSNTGMIIFILLSVSIYVIWYLFTRARYTRRIQIFVFVFFLLLVLAAIYLLYFHHKFSNADKLGISSVVDIYEPNSDTVANQQLGQGKQLPLENGSFRKANKVKDAQESAYDNLSKKVDILLSPFTDLDPVDRELNFKDRDKCFNDILAILNAGRPSDVEVEHWNLLVKRLFEYFDYSESAMDRSLVVVQSWIDSGRPDDEILSAMLSILGWSETKTIEVHSVEHDRFSKIADLFLRLSQASDDNISARSLWCASKLRRNFSGSKEIINSPIIQANELISRVMTEVDNRSNSVFFREQALIILSSRLIQEPSEYAAYNGYIKKLLDDNSIGLSAKILTLEMLSNKAKFNTVPSIWFDDKYILDHLNATRNALKK